MMFVMCSFFCIPVLMHAQETDTNVDDQSMKVQIDSLNSEIDKHQSRIKEIDALVTKYQNKIKEQENKQSSLENELVILENQSKKKEFDIERTKVQLESLGLEIRVLQDQVLNQSNILKRQRSYVADLIRDLHQADSISIFQVLLYEPSLSAFFDRLEEKKRLQDNLFDAMQKVKTKKSDLEAIKQKQDTKKIEIEKQNKILRKEQLALIAEQNFKASLIGETKMKQEELDRVMYELQQQQQSTSQDISDLESTLKDKLDTVDAALSRGDILLNWPVDASKGITATFHDPTYPFRNLFQHPGIDIRASVGTAIHAAAGGYVAWNKKGRLYGNYLMVVHPGNVATVYAHISKFIAKPDTYVQRGDILGLTGGQPGSPGAGLSTGPHLHFEVRQNGIPVNPENFLPSIATDD